MADNLSPDSEKSIYFDAPMEQQQQQPPFTMFADASTSAPRQGNSGAPVPERTDNYVVDRPGSSSGWLPAADLPQEHTQTDHFNTQEGVHAGQPNLPLSTAPQRNISIRSPSPLAHRALNIRSPSPTPGTSAQGISSDIRRSGSRRSMFTAPAGHPIEGSTFIGGAATTGPHSIAHPTEELTSRAAAADAGLSRKDRSRIIKSEAEDGRRLSKIIKDEGRAEKQALGLAISELSMLQKDQANAIQNEAKAHEERAKLQADCQKQESLFMAARARYEAAQARLNAEDDALEIVRNKARDATEKLQEKSQEVDSLRTMFAVDERERAAKLASINEKPKRAGSGCVIA